MIGASVGVPRGELPVTVSINVSMVCFDMFRLPVGAYRRVGAWQKGWLDFGERAYEGEIGMAMVIRYEV